MVLLVEELRSFNCEVEFLDRPLSQDPHEELLLQIRGAVAQYERSLIAERMRRGRQMKLKAGLMLPWSKSPYGYRLSVEHPRDPKGVTIDEAEAATVREVFATYLEGGVSIAEITKRVQAQGVRTPAGKGLWRVSTVRAILTNPVYTGKVWAGRWRTRPATKRRSALKPVGRKNESRDRQPKEEWILVAQVPKIISEEEFELAQEKLEENRQRARRNNKKGEYLVRGMISCGMCKLSCTGRSDLGGYSYYVCRGKVHPTMSGLSQRCLSRAMPVRELDEVVWKDVCEIIQEPEQIEAAIRRMEQGEWQPQQIKARKENLRRARTGLGKQMERLTEAYLQGVIGLEEYQRRRREIEERVEALGKQEKELEMEADRSAEIGEKVKTMKEFCERVRLGLEGATFEQKRRLVEMLIDR
jgi:site-specific DNA recombinase